MKTVAYSPCFIYTILLVRLRLASPSSCLTISLYDLFGDGWNDIKLVKESASGDVQYSSPNCSANPLIEKICGVKDGFYYFGATNTGNGPAKNWWEVRLRIIFL